LTLAALAGLPTAFAEINVLVNNAGLAAGLEPVQDAGTTPLTAADIAEAVVWACDQPPHVNINLIELMPVVQSQGRCGSSVTSSARADRQRARTNPPNTQC
jgi:NADP-dependent 3-hydroxy acid dehydrogenase YdfG